MDTDFTRKNAQGSRDDAQAEITPNQICGSLPKGFDPKTYVTSLKITAYTHDGDRFDPRSYNRSRRHPWPYAGCHLAD
jgi:hypothetical protein